jgi:hypothetical protein
MVDLPPPVTVTDMYLAAIHAELVAARQAREPSPVQAGPVLVTEPAVTAPGPVRERGSTRGTGTGSATRRRKPRTNA